MNTIDFIGEFLWFGMLATPLFSYFIVRSLKTTLSRKILLGVCITILLAVVMGIISMAILFRNGLGPV